MNKHECNPSLFRDSVLTEGSGSAASDQHCLTAADAETYRLVPVSNSPLTAAAKFDPALGVKNDKLDIFHGIRRSVCGSMQAGSGLEDIYERAQREDTLHCASPVAFHVAVGEQI